MEKVILVDAEDNEIGLMEKMQAHKKNLLHRAVSVMIFDDEGNILLQRRAENKYHSSLLWSNAACTHPKPGEENKQAAIRRLNEEMGLNSDLEKIYSFIYQVDFESDLSENEFDHVFFGVSEEKPNPNPAEVSDYKYIALADLLKDIKINDEDYTEWFKIIINQNHKLISDYIQKIQ